MGRRKYNWNEAVSYLHEQCPPLSRFMNSFGPRRLPMRQEGSAFIALSRAVAYQQLSGKAAGTIYGRFLDLFPERQPKPELAIKLGIEPLRGVGLSQAKTLSILDLAAHTTAGQLPSPQRMGRMSDAAIIDALCAVRGIGPWTAQMYLIFNLGRPDVMPVADLAVQKGVRNIYQLPGLPSEAEMLTRTQHLVPFRSVASWYFWRASEAPEYQTGPTAKS